MYLLHFWYWKYMQATALFLNILFLRHLEHQDSSLRHTRVKAEEPLSQEMNITYFFHNIRTTTQTAEAVTGWRLWAMQSFYSRYYYRELPQNCSRQVISKSCNKANCENERSNAFEAENKVCKNWNKFRFAYALAFLEQAIAKHRKFQISATCVTAFLQINEVVTNGCLVGHK